jgi:hypothetical protein
MDRDQAARDAARPRRVAHIVVRDEFGPLLSAAFPECEIMARSGETHITASVRDEAELFGLLDHLGDFGAELVSVSVDR